MNAKIVEWWGIIEPYAGFLALGISIVSVIWSVKWVIQKCRQRSYNKRGSKQNSEANSEDSATRWRGEHDRKLKDDPEQYDRSEVDNFQPRQISEANLEDSATRWRGEYDRKLKDDPEQYDRSEVDNFQPRQISEANLEDSATRWRGEYDRKLKDDPEQYDRSEVDNSQQTNRGERTMRKLGDWLIREAKANRGLNYLDRGDFDKAIEHYNELIQNDSDEPEWYILRGRAYREAALKEKRQTEPRRNTAKSDDYFQKSDEDYKKALELSDQ